MTGLQSLTAIEPRRLNHVEFAHRPGEGEMVVELFEALGCRCEVSDTPPFGKYIVVRLDETPHGDNDMFASEAEPEQLALEDRLRRLRGSDRDLAEASAHFRALQRDRPYRATHIGLRVPSITAFDKVVANLDRLVAAGFEERLELGAPILRSEPEARAMSAPMKQLWLWTDVMSTGLLITGQQIELQAYNP